LQFFFNSKAPGEKQRLLAAFENFARENNLPDDARKNADLALEEAITNILSYAFADKNEHTIEVQFTVARGELLIEIADDGRPFDPTKHPIPDLTIPADRRKIGGLGIHMIRQSMDTLEYHRTGDRNILRMRKRF
jgi:anti-sigma regulatory factor (Ser/Thr protein kinase)